MATVKNRTVVAQPFRVAQPGRPALQLTAAHRLVVVLRKENAEL